MCIVSSYNYVQLVYLHKYIHTYIHTCIILCGKLKEAVTGYKSHVHHGGTCDPSCLIWYN